MKRIVLISCASKKLPRIARARHLYISPLFQLNLQYAQCQAPDAIYILSAKYGLLHLDDEVAPYNVTLNDMTASQRRAWANQVLEQLSQRADLQKDEFIFLAGQRYREHLIPRIAHCEVPMEGLSIGKQLRALKRLIDEHCL